MGILSKLDGSSDLVNGLAARVGADLNEMVARNPEFEGRRYRNMVLRCATCPDQEACTKLQRACDHLDAAPVYCLNKHIMDQLSRR